MKKKGLSLIELMIAVSILSIGIVAVLRSFLSVTTAIDSTSNLISSFQFLEDKANELELEAYRQDSVETDVKREAVKLNHRKAIYTIETSKVEFQQEQEQKEKLERFAVNEFNLTLSWQESGRQKQTTLSTYFPERITFDDF